LPPLSVARHELLRCTLPKAAASRRTPKRCGAEWSALLQEQPNVVDGHVVAVADPALIELDLTGERGDSIRDADGSIDLCV